MERAEEEKRDEVEQKERYENPWTSNPLRTEVTYLFKAEEGH